MASGRVRAKYNLARDVRRSDNVLKSSAQQAQEQNEAAADSSFWGRLGGMGLGTIAGLALAPITGGSSLLLAAGGAGLGSFFGSKAAQEAAGGIDTTVESGGFGLDKVSDVNKELRDYEKGVDQDRYMNAASDAFTVYTAGGGLSGGGIGGGTGAFSGGAMDLTKMGLTAKSSGLEIMKAQMKAQAKQLAFGGAKQYGKQKLGLDTYEAYIKDNT